MANKFGHQLFRVGLAWIEMNSEMYDHKANCGCKVPGREKVESKGCQEMQREER